MGESVCTKLIWIVCATWCASITWIACITCMGMHALHKLSGLHEQRAICVLDWSLFFFILVFNFIFIWLCSFLSKQKRLKIYLSFWYRIFFSDSQYIPGNDSEHASIGSIKSRIIYGHNFVWTSREGLRIAWCDLCFWRWSAVFGTQGGAHIYQLEVVFEVSISTTSFPQHHPHFVIVIIANVISDVDDFSAFGEVVNGSGDLKCMDEKCPFNNLKKYFPKIPFHKTLPKYPNALLYTTTKCPSLPFRTPSWYDESKEGHALPDITISSSVWKGMPFSVMM